MCGIAGAIQNGKNPITVKTLTEMAKGIVTRGKHAYGIAWVTSNNRMRMHKWCGPITDNLEIFDHVRDAKAVIMHTRWATHGDAEANENNHPHPVDGGWFVHNGQIPNYEELIEEYDLLPSSECDSEVLGLLMETLLTGQDALAITKRAKAAIDLCDNERPLCMAAIFANPTRLVVAKRGNPLFVGIGSSGNLYFSSCRRGLPQGGRPLEENMVFTHTLDRRTKKPWKTQYLKLNPFRDTGVKVAGSGASNDWSKTARQRKAEEALWPDDEKEADRWAGVEEALGTERAAALRILTARSGDLPPLSREEGMRRVTKIKRT